MQRIDDKCIHRCAHPGLIICCELRKFRPIQRSQRPPIAIHNAGFLYDEPIGPRAAINDPAADSCNFRGCERVRILRNWRVASDRCDQLQEIARIAIAWHNDWAAVAAIQGRLPMLQ